MAIIVDKAQKKQDIALSCKKLLLKNHLADLTVSQIAKSAGIGKGTIYEYFENKEDIVFEIITILMHESDIRKHEKLMNIKSTKDKLKVFFEFYYDQQSREMRTIYKEFLSITLICPNQKIRDFQTNCYETYYKWITQIIQDGVYNGEIIPQSTQLIKGLFAFGTGIFVNNETTNSIDDIEKEINDLIDTIFELIKK